ncbi:MAG: AlpA family phage regulatory protein [Methylibium sp.]|uniref:helix-turn-helix transcriptional regulator n=1 Tax=Methylibium sp. TaxID=2067992 RepID=UPI00182E6024|nr:AlpA family phage regulatory protein [Methylibium sp.]MBA3599419.1 AlpA family phage regulatory protein [Methylibium sp.]
MAADTFRQALDAKALARRRQVEQLVQLSRSTIYANVKAGTFPAPIRIGARAVAWRLADVEAWLEARPLASATV